MDQPTFWGEVIPQVVEGWLHQDGNQQPAKNWMHFDNARPHLIPSKMDPPKFHLLKAPPYSPDLSSCDFLFFPWLKSKMESEGGPDLTVVKFDWVNWVNNIPEEYYTDLVDRWLDQCQKVLDAGG
ncbi:hypothetical protein GGH92_004838, partial [Coemansia sp. RSA 2673]